MAGGMNRPGTALPAFLREGAARALAAERARAFCWVHGAGEQGGPWPGVVVRWERGGDGWRALVAYVVTDPAGHSCGVVEVVPGGRLSPGRGGPPSVVSWSDDSPG